MNTNNGVLEEEYEKDVSKIPEPSRRALLPIKTKAGVIPQTVLKHEQGNTWL